MWEEDDENSQQRVNQYLLNELSKLRSEMRRLNDDLLAHKNANVDQENNFVVNFAELSRLLLRISSLAKKTRNNEEDIWSPQIWHQKLRDLLDHHEEFGNHFFPALVFFLLFRKKSNAQKKLLCNQAKDLIMSWVSALMNHRPRKRFFPTFPGTSPVFSSVCLFFR
jgi:hypothetical protein